MSRSGILCSKNEIKEYRLATEQEIEQFYKHYPKYIPKPKWEDFGKVSGYKIGYNSNMYEIVSEHSSFSNKNAITTKKEARAMLALIQLMQWRDKYNEEKLEDWCN